MNNRFLPHLKFLSVACVALLIAACGGGGGGGGSDSGNDGEGQSSSFATSTNQVGNASAGRELYVSYCVGCHGASYGKAKNYAETLSAIQRDKGGMKYLDTYIKTTQANDIATYLTYGVSTSGPTLTSQSITFTSTGDQTLGGTPAGLTASASSGLVVTITSSTPTVCSANGSVLTLLSVGTCTLTASQMGNASYAAAAPVSVSFAVTAATGAAQSILFTSPGNQTLVFGTAPAIMPAPLAATATSNLPVTFATATRSVCTVSGVTLTMLQPGTCTIAAIQAGDAVYAAAPTVSNSFLLIASNAAAGKVAYNQVINGQSCAGCHGAPGSQPASLILSAANADVVLGSAIAFNVGGMGGLVYTQQQILDITAYLATPGI
jgi:mono/diheme cytochrome c family protein